MREALGTLLIIGAVVAEVYRRRGTVGVSKGPEA